jgi:hypothetical protein
MKYILLVGAILLVLGMFALPIGYYTFLRITTTIVAIAVIVTQWKGRLTLTVALFAIVAIVFNPVVPVYLHSKSAWQVIDLAAAVVFMAKVFVPHAKSV